MEEYQYSNFADAIDKLFYKLIHSFDNLNTELSGRAYSVKDVMYPILMGIDPSETVSVFNPKKNRGKGRTTKNLARMQF